MSKLRRGVLIVFGFALLFISALGTYLEFTKPTPLIIMFFFYFIAFLGGIQALLQTDINPNIRRFNKFWLWGMIIYYSGFLFFRWGTTPHAILTPVRHLIISVTVMAVGLVVAFQGQVINERLGKNK